MRWLVACALAACSSRGSEPPQPARGRGDTARAVDGGSGRDPTAPATAIEQRKACGDVVAIWRGHRENGLDAYEELEFIVPGARTPLRFSHGEMYPPYWSFDIFAPDCRHVLLLPAYTGPYHVVRTSRLAPYLGGAAPDHVLRGRLGESGTVANGAWVSASEIRYQWGCCDPPIELRFKLPLDP
jgi:hypothetical protein